MRWTEGQDDVLFEYGNLGVKECQRILRREFQANHTVSAIQRRASRIGASLFMYSVCPSCGRRVRELRNSGLCFVCNEKHKANQQRVSREGLQKELERLESKNEPNAEYENARKNYFSNAVAAHRLRSKIGKYEKFIEMSNEKSKSCSD